MESHALSAPAAIAIVRELSEDLAVLEAILAVAHQYDERPDEVRLLAVHARLNSKFANLRRTLHVTESA